MPSDGPEAELWMGAHPSAPSVVVRDGQPANLNEVIGAAPERELGPDCAARFGGRLPFLLKVLAAEKALSIQVHPSRAQAEVGYAEETQRGLTPGDPARNYVDDWPKPELLCALTPFEVLAGMRSAPDAAQFLRALSVDRLRAAGVEMALAAGVEMAAVGAAEAVGCALATILAWPSTDRAALIADVVAACQRVAAAAAAGPGQFNAAAGPYAAACAAVVRLADEHPGDIGVAAALLLRHAILEPGEAVFMPAGGLHAYLHGTGIELLANSDNVVRGGLTGKHLDVHELLKLLDPAVAVPVFHPVPLGDGVVDYGDPAPEFRLYRADLTDEPTQLPGGSGPRIVLCVSGAAVLRNPVGDAAAAGPGQFHAAKLAHGESAFLSAADALVTATGPAQLFIAACGV